MYVVVDCQVLIEISTYYKYIVWVFVDMLGNSCFYDWD